MDIQPRTTVAAPVDDKAWLGSTHGTDCPITGTAILANFDATKHLDADGNIPGGLPVVYDDASKSYLPAINDEAVPGTFVQATPDGHIRETVAVNSGSEAVGVSILWHGVVIASEVPVPEGETFDGDNGADHILYR